MKASDRARDEWLALRCQAKDHGALEDLVAEMERPLLYYATKLTGSEDNALDVLQEVWLRALPAVRKLKDPSSVRSWLYSMVHGIAIDRFRKDHSRERAEDSQGGLVGPSTRDEQFSAADAVAIHQALDRLPQAQREILVLHFLEGFSLAEISRIIDCPEGTVKSRLHYAKKALKVTIQGETHAHE